MSELFPYGLRKSVASTSFPYVAAETVSTVATENPYRNTPESNLSDAKFPYIDDATLESPYDEKTDNIFPTINRYVGINRTKAIQDVDIFKIVS